MFHTRNARLAAVKSFFRYVAAHEPVALPIVQRVLAVPMKRFDRKLVGYLTADLRQRPASTKEKYPPVATITWSRATIPTNSDAALSRSVRSPSSTLAAASPLG